MPPCASVTRRSIAWSTLSVSASVASSALFFTIRICPFFVSPTNSRPSGANAIVAETVVAIFAMFVSLNPAGSVDKSWRPSSGSISRWDI